VATAFQELSLVPNLTVAQNLSLPRQPKGGLGLVSGAATQKRGAAILERFGLRLSPSAVVAGLTLAERQRLQITPAFACHPNPRPGACGLGSWSRPSGDSGGGGGPFPLASAG